MRTGLPQWPVSDRRWLRRLVLTPVVGLCLVGFLVGGIGVGVLFGWDAWRHELRSVWR